MVPVDGYLVRETWLLRMPLMLLEGRLVWRRVELEGRIYAVLERRWITRGNFGVLR